MAVGQHLAGMDHQQSQQIVFLGRELDLLASHASPMRRTRSTDEIARTNTGALALRLEAVAQRGAQARHQLLHAEGLGDVIVGAEIERLDLAALVVADRQHDDRHVVEPCGRRG